MGLKGKKRSKPKGGPDRLLGHEPVNDEVSVGVPLASVSSCVTLFRTAVPPCERDTPTAMYPMPRPRSQPRRRQVQCADGTQESAPALIDKRPCPCGVGSSPPSPPLPSAPVFVPSLGTPLTAEEAIAQGCDFALGGARFQLLAGALDTGCDMEAARVTLLPGSGLPAVRLCVSDAWTVGLSGRALVQINGAVYQLTQGASAYIRAGSIYALSCPSDAPVPAVLVLAFVCAGPMGFYRSAADLLVPPMPCDGAGDSAQALAPATAVAPPDQLERQLARLALHHGLCAC